MTDYFHDTHSNIDLSFRKQGLQAFAIILSAADVIERRRIYYGWCNDLRIVR